MAGTTRTWLLGGGVALALVAIGVGGYVWKSRGRGASSGGAGPAGKHDVPDVAHVEPANATVTFNRDVAPIVFTHCSGCHHPGEAVAPFPLVRFEDLRKRGEMVADVVGSRHMPPWMPSADGPKFVGERRLSDAQVAVIQTWVKEGMARGKPEDLTAKPQWKEGWELGTPDLIVRMPEPFTMPADGKDVYRNFVLPVEGLDRSRWVRAVEMRPGGRRVVHHAFTMVDDSGTARERDGRDGQPGYPGMAPGFGVSTPGGQIISWQPGKRATQGPAGSAWRLAPGQDIVVQLHMRPGGKPEEVRSEVGLYFTDEPPAGNRAALCLRSLKIDIPAGSADHAVGSQYRLPVDAIITGILPHAHYLGKSVEAWATLPDGSRRDLLRIKQWDFDWQGDYQYADPVKLPAGTLLQMRWTFDNSEANPQNPHRPPQRVKYGPNSTDEMAEVWLQVVTLSLSDSARLGQHFATTYGFPDAIERCKVLLADTPDDVELLVELAAAYVKAQRNEDAIEALNKALSLQPDHANAHYTMAHVYASREDSANATKHLKETLRIDPKHYKAHNNLGYIQMAAREFGAAEASFLEAVRIAPQDLRSRLNLGQLYLQQKQFAKAIPHFEAILKSDPTYAPAKQGLEAAKRGAGQ